MKFLKYFALAFGLGLFGFWLASNSMESASAEPAPDVVYLCRETGELVKAPREPVPAVNPKTGRETLYRALYCADCRAWHAVPPPDAFPGNPLGYPCPKHRRPMTADGPWEEQ